LPPIIFLPELDSKNKAVKCSRQQDDVIVIPPELHGLPVSEIEISVRLHNVLVSNHLRYLGDLHGLPFYRVGALKNCGRKCLLELRHPMSWSFWIL
jgi:hypothetical protein